VLLKAGPEWATEIALPKELQNPGEMAVDGEHRVWIKATGQATTALVREDGSIELFNLPNGGGAHLVTFEGRILAAAARSNVSAIVAPQAVSNPARANCSEMKAASQVSVNTSSILLSKGAK
jgi:streptogramin lyase